LSEPGFEAMPATSALFRQMEIIGLELLSYLPTIVSRLAVMFMPPWGINIKTPN
jgi:hypothetical protein